MKLKYSKGKIFVQGARNEITGLKRWFNRFVENYMFSPLYKNKLWNGKRTRYNKDENSVPFGLWQEVYRCANEHNYDINFINKKDFPLNRDIKEEDFKNFVNSFFKGYMYKGKEFKPRPYQMRIAYKILKNRYCNIAVATSGGKTLIFALVFFYLLHNNKDRKFLLVVPSKTLVTQFYDDLINFDWNNKLDLNIGEIYGKEEKPRILYPDKDVNLYIGTFQSLSNSKNYPRKWFKQFYSITLDECLHPDTLVSMDNNTQKKISDIVIGDLVKTVNETTGDIEYKPVEKIHKNLSISEQMFEITMDDNTSIKITGNHKVQLFNGEWKRADELNEGDDILYIK